MMQDATISNQDKQSEKKSQQQPQGMYQRGKYPSIIDTDDMVFEMGVQLVGNLNKEKLLDNLMKRAAALEKATAETAQAKTEIENKIAQLKESNRLYIENNQKLDAELVRVRKEVEAVKKEFEVELIKASKVLESVRVANQASVKEYEKKIISLIETHKQEIVALKSRKKKVPKKKD